jgi:Dehydrogenases with different specificities (related to short-chain alcohol dehydrogenases)
MKLKNKVSIVTGSASGFGKGIAELFSKEGAKLIIADINQEAGEKVVYDLKNLGGEAEFIKTDVSNSDSMKNLVEKTDKIFGKLDILVSNAGWSYVNKSSIKVTESEINKLLDINIKSLYFERVFGVELMRKNSGGGV